MSKLFKILVGVALATAVFAVIFFSSFTVVTIHGNEVGVRETWGDGVNPNPLLPKTYWLNRWTNDVYTYDVGGQVFVMNDKTNSEEPVATGRRFDSLVVNSSDNQKVTYTLTFTWHRDPAHIVAQHIHYRDDIEERLIRPAIIKSMQAHATLLNAIDQYSGTQLNTLRSQVFADLTDPKGAFVVDGIVGDNFVLDRPTLTKEYEEQIDARQLAIITQSRANEQKLANDALALAASAEAQAEANRQIVAAQAAKSVAILQQQAIAQQSITQANADAANAVTRQTAESQKIVLAAQAEADRQIAVSAATKQAEINRAVGIEAVGRAQAAANQLLLSSYAVKGGDLYTRIQVARSLGDAFSGVKGYLPQGMSMNLVAENYDKAVSLLMNSQQTPAPAGSHADAAFQAAAP